MQKIVSAIFKTFLLSLMVIADLHFAFAQSTQQGIIPNGKATFLDNNGKPVSSGTVDFYVPGTSTRKTTYQDINGTVPNTNPVTLDAAGRALLWGTGSYRQVVKDKNGNQIWDVTTSSAGSSSGGGGGGTATGDGDLVGTIKPWGGFAPPNQYLFTYGQELSRTTYSALFAAITQTQAVFCTSGSPILTGIGDTTNAWIGMTIETPCVPAGSSTIVSKTSSTITLAVNANTSVNTNAIFFSWGNGNGSTTFNLPDLRGVVPMGNNNMGGVASSLVSTGTFGNTNPNSAGALGGSQNATLTTANLPNHTHISPTFNDPGHTHTITSSPTVSLLSSAGGSVNYAGGANNTVGVGALTNSTNTTGITIGAQTGGCQISGGCVASPLSLIQPSKTVNYIIKVTPDANSATASGVTSFGSMTGDIACGAGLTCTGNIVSAVTSGVASLGGQTGAITCGAGLTCSGGSISSTSTAPGSVSLSACMDTVYGAGVWTQYAGTPGSGSDIGPALTLCYSQLATRYGNGTDAHGTIIVSPGQFALNTPNLDFRGVCLTGAGGSSQASVIVYQQTSGVALLWTGKNSLGPGSFSGGCFNNIALLLDSGFGATSAVPLQLQGVCPAAGPTTTGTGGTGGVASTSFTFSPIPSIAPVINGSITGTGITAGTTIIAYNGGTGVATLSQVATVTNGTTVTYSTPCYQPDQWSSNDIYISAVGGTSYWANGPLLDGTARQFPQGIRVGTITNWQIFQCINYAAFFKGIVQWTISNLGTYTGFGAPGTITGMDVWVSGNGTALTNSTQVYMNGLVVGGNLRVNNSTIVFANGIAQAFVGNNTATIVDATLSLSLALAGNSSMTGVGSRVHVLNHDNTTLAAGSCGTSPGTPTGGDYRGQVTEGTSATGCLITFAKPFATTPICSVTPQNAAIATSIASISNTTLSWSHSSQSGAVMTWQCDGF